MSQPWAKAKPSSTWAHLLAHLLRQEAEFELNTSCSQTAHSIVSPMCLDLDA